MIGYILHLGMTTCHIQRAVEIFLPLQELGQRSGSAVALVAVETPACAYTILQLERFSLKNHMIIKQRQCVKK
jgi:hypothetical protein